MIRTFILSTILSLYTIHVDVKDRIGTKGPGKMTIVEFNVYRYKKIELEGQSTLLVSAYSKRSYGANITPFLTNLRADRKSCLDEMITFKLPTLKIAR